MKATNPSAVRVLKTATCPSLSGKSKLTYHIGGEENAEGVCTSKSAIYVRVHANSGEGYFNNDWIPLTAIQLVLDKTKLVTFASFGPLFRGKSVNTAGFLLAAVKNEGLVRNAKDDKRSYERADTKAFRAAVDALLKSPVALRPAAKPVQSPEDKTQPPEGKAKPPEDKTKTVSPARKTPSKSSGKKKA